MFRMCSYFICQSKRIENDQTKLTAQCTSHAATQANTSLEWSRPCSAAAWEKSCSLARLAKLGWLWHFGFLDYFSSSPNMIWMKTPFPCCALLISTQRLSISSSFPGPLSVQVAKSQTLAIAFEDETSSQYATTWGQQHLPQEDSIRKKNRTQSTRSHNMQCANAKVMFDNFCTLTYYIPYCFWTAVVVLQTNCFVHLFLHQQEESFRHRAMKKQHLHTEGERYSGNKVPNTQALPDTTSQSASRQRWKLAQPEALDNGPKDRCKPAQNLTKHVGRSKLRPASDEKAMAMPNTKKPEKLKWEKEPLNRTLMCPSVTRHKLKNYKRNIEWAFTKVS